jgi:hypothetical protein
MRQHSPHPRHHVRHEQRGAVLIVSLIMLAVMTLLVISMLKTSIFEFKIGGVSQIAALNLANAEMAVNKYIADNNGRFAPGFLTLPALSTGCNNTTVGPGQCNDPPLVNGGTVVVFAQQVGCGLWANFNTQMGGTTLRAAQFDVRATATGNLGGMTVTHQGAQTIAPPGSC